MRSAFSGWWSMSLSASPPGTRPGSITDFAYWLFITDLGVARDWAGRGIGARLVRRAHQEAGGEKDVILYTCANRNAAPFYQKLGMKHSQDVMEYNHIDWTEFTVS